MYELIPQVLVTSAVRTADGNGPAVLIRGQRQGVLFEFDLTNAATDLADTLDVFIQALAPDNENWVDVVHFTQIVGNGANTQRYFAKINSDLTTAEFENASALGAAAVRNLMSRQYRVRWVIADSGDADQTFTFAVHALPL